MIYQETPETQGWLRVYRAGEADAYVADFLVERAPMRFYPVDQEPILVASGQGKEITDVFDIPEGAYRIDATVEDVAFILSSVVIEGDCRDTTVFNEINFDATRLNISALFISNGCSIIFETDNVDGAWIIEVRDILDPEVIAQTLIAVENGTTIAGTGRALTMPTELPEGVWSISANVNDQAFILAPQVLTGDCDDMTVFNEVSFDVEKLELSAVYRSPEDGCIIFWETSNVEKDWELVFEKIK